MPRLTLTDVSEICLQPFLQREHAVEATRIAAAEAEAARSRGVSWSGFAVEPHRRRDAEAIGRDARVARDQTRAFAVSPQGRFLACLDELEIDWPKETAAARAACARGFSDPAGQPCAAEIGCALSALARLDAPAARTACLVLAGLLGAALGVAA